ncbi:hypothetical protein Isop_1777 [Isosphaera pallida ATCC 43644]|uniref:Flp/Fap pilin component n=1 Tax=Isosphaera pallida (strain ATCC 43644 / DSM 9630 / IS1B) TaxID=575540 RepID=E8R1E3_ISOPI|nr:Flp family type IVb pilin [Isosphaera pallida]ADV62360.1 hypothetical protein Isop_1777 [Isosphaera pallida ATCC 43644]
MRLQDQFRRLHHQEEAATSIEYAVMLLLILLAVIGSIQTFGGSNNGVWGDNVQTLDDGVWSQVGIGGGGGGSGGGGS